MAVRYGTQPGGTVSTTPSAGTCWRHVPEVKNAGVGGTCGADTVSGVGAIGNSAATTIATHTRRNRSGSNFAIDSASSTPTIGLSATPMRVGTTELNSGLS